MCLGKWQHWRPHPDHFLWWTPIYRHILEDGQSEVLNRAQDWTPVQKHRRERDCRDSDHKCENSDTWLSYAILHHQSHSSERLEPAVRRTEAFTASLTSGADRVFHHSSLFSWLYKSHPWDYELWSSWNQPILDRKVQYQRELATKLAFRDSRIWK